MKNLNMLLMGFAAMAFVACDEPAPSVPPVQANPQGPVLENATLTGTPQGVYADGQTLNLEAYVQNPQILVLNLDQIAGMPEGGVVHTRYEMADNADFEKSHTIEMKVEGNQAYVNAFEVNEAHITIFGKNPKAMEVYYRVAGFILLDGTDYRMGGMDYYVAEGKMKECRMDPGYVVEDAYYFLSDATTTTLADATAYEFSHGEADVYDDPVFTYTVETTQPNTTWRIAPQSAVVNNSEAGVLGVEGDQTALTGTLKAGAAAGKLVDAGKYNFTINLETMAYTIKPVLYPDMLATPGEANGWNQLASSWVRASGEGYYGDVIIAKGSMKLTDQADGTNWTNELTWGEGEEEGTLVNAGGGNIAVGDQGAYWMNVDLVNLTYALTPITSIGVVGNLNGWNQAEPIELTPNADFTVWTADVTFDNADWKIVLNHDWAFSYGGSVEEPHYNWGNFAGVDGTYTVSFVITGNVPVITMVAK